MQQAIQLIVGLGNPGPEYEHTRHNAGDWFVQALAEQHGAVFRTEAKFKSRVCKLHLETSSCLLQIPSTYMNESGQAVAALAKFHKIDPTAILVAHDELDFPVGNIKLKQSGGHGGHNGLRDIIKYLGSSDFMRLRIGIGHPGHRDRVHGHVLNRPSSDEADAIHEALNQATAIFPQLIAGDIDSAIRELHTRELNNGV